MICCKFVHIWYTEFFNSLTQLMICSDKVGSVIWRDLSNWASSADKPAEGIYARRRIQTFCNLNMYGSWGHTCKYNAVTFLQTAPLLNFEGAEIVNSGKGERRYIWLHTTTRQICHHLTAGSYILSPAYYTPSHQVLDCQASLNHPVLLSQFWKHMVSPLVTTLLVHMPEYQSYYMMVSWK